MKNFFSKGIQFSGNSIKSCVGFIDLIDSTKNTITMEGSESIRKYYSTFINYVSDSIKNSGGKVIKNIGDSLLFYFPITSDSRNITAFKEALECGFKILIERYKINKELSKQHLPPFNYRISMDYGVLDLALVGDYNQIDLFGTTINICSKINSSSLSVPNEITIGDNLYRILKSFSSISNDFHFIENGEYKITQFTSYPTYKLERKNNTIYQNVTNFNNVYSLKKLNCKKRIILIDDEQDILFTYRIILRNYNDYQVTSFTDPLIALNYIRDLSDFDNLLVILDIRMKDLNGLQLHQQIKAIDPTIKIIFITALDILDELLSIFPGIKREQIMKKPIDNKDFITTIKKMIK